MFLVRGGMRAVEFKVVETDPAPYCIVRPCYYTILPLVVQFKHMYVKIRAAFLFPPSISLVLYFLSVAFYSAVATQMKHGLLIEHMYQDGFDYILS